MRHSYAGWAGVLALVAAPLALAQPAPQAQHGPAPAPAQQHGMAPAHQAAQAPHMTMQRPAMPAPAPHMTAQRQTAPQPMAMQGGGPRPMQHGPAPELHMAMAPSHDWHRGDRFDGNRQVVSNWSHYHADAPPPGYEWVQDGNELVLISISTGVIATVLANIIQ